MAKLIPAPIIAVVVIRESLQAAAASATPPSYPKYCKSLGLRKYFTRRRFRAEVTALAGAHAAYKKRLSLERIAEKEAKLEAAAQRLKEQRLPINLKTLQAETGILAWRNSVALQNVLARHAVAI